VILAMAIDSGHSFVHVPARIAITLLAFATAAMARAGSDRALARARAGKIPQRVGGE
jgi:hypothetical protein